MTPDRSEPNGRGDAYTTRSSKKKERENVESNADVNAKNPFLNIPTGDVMFAKLKAAYGKDLKETPRTWGMTLDDLNKHIRKECGGSEDEVREVLNTQLGRTYDEKYLMKKGDDVRDTYPQWKEMFCEILKNLSDPGKKVSELDGIVVGVGSGEDACIYRDLKSITLVDIGENILNEIRKKLDCRNVTTYCLNAQDLNRIQSNSFDVYISLLTYQSTFFDVEKSAREAYRVLKDDGVIIISVANGYIDENGEYQQGEKSPIDGKLDHNKPLDVARRVRHSLVGNGFESVDEAAAPSEIFIYGRVGTKNKRRLPDSLNTHDHPSG